MRWRLSWRSMTWSWATIMAKSGFAVVEPADVAVPGEFDHVDAVVEAFGGTIVLVFKREVGQLKEGLVALGTVGWGIPDAKLEEGDGAGSVVFVPTPSERRYNR